MSFYDDFMISLDWYDVEVPLYAGNPATCVSCVAVPDRVWNEKIRPLIEASEEEKK